MGSLNRRCWVLAVVAAFLVAAPGCSPPRPVRTYEYVTDYERMADAYEPLVSLLYVPDATALSPYRGVVVGDIQVGNHWVESPERAHGYATFFRVMLGRELSKLNKFDFVTLDKDYKGQDGSLAGVLLLEGMITKFDMGSGLMRYMSYFLWLLQSGATDFQIEGRVTEAGSGALVLEFVDRRRHLGNTPFGPNPSNFKNGFTMRVTAKETAKCVARLMDMAYDGLQPVALDKPADQGVAEQL